MAFGKIVIAALWGLATLTGSAFADDENAGPVVLTVVGDVAEPNRGAYDQFHDAFFHYHEMTFDQGYVFDRAALEELPQVTVAAQAPHWPSRVEATGPSLKNVLDAAGVDAEATVTVFALDGYGIDFAPADRAAQDWILAISANGEPLGIGGRGPAWLMHPVEGIATPEDESTWVWAAFAIEVK